jgi:hypothetical protein
MTGWLRRGGRLACAWIAAALLAACGGGVGTGGTGSEAQGPITGFGSVIVAGVTWDDTSATVLDDDGNAVVRDGNELRLGMTVEIDGTDGDAPVARTIRMDSTVVGPAGSVDAAGRAVTVLGQNVRIDAGTVFDDTLPNGLADVRTGDVLAVFALAEAAGGGQLATRIERAPANASFRLRGTVADLNASAGTLRIGGLTLDFGGAGNVPATLANGMVVRLTLGGQNAGGRWNVTGFGREDVPPQHGEEVRIDGLISGYVSASRFVVGGLTVNASEATVRPVGAVLANGVRVQVRGRMFGNVVAADRVQVRGSGAGSGGGNGTGVGGGGGGGGNGNGGGNDDDGIYRMNGRISVVDVSAGTFVIRRTIVDYRRAAFQGGTSADVVAGAVVRVEGPLSADGTRLLATRVEFLR